MPGCFTSVTWPRVYQCIECLYVGYAARKLIMSPGALSESLCRKECSWSASLPATLPGRAWLIVALTRCGQHQVGGSR